jgi:hypothetical protein
MMAYWLAKTFLFWRRRRPGIADAYAHWETRQFPNGDGI